MPSLQSLALFIFLLLSAALYGQEPPPDASQKKIVLFKDFQIGMLAGGQLENEKFIYKPGIAAQFSVNVQLSPSVQGGVGVGLQSLETETILPVFLDFKAQLKPGDSSPFIGVNLGGTRGWSTYYRNFTDYDYEGGFYFSPYYSFQFPLSDKMKLLVVAGYVHQTGEIEYFTDFNEEYEEEFAMDFITLRIGLRF